MAPNKDTLLNQFYWFVQKCKEIFCHLGDPPPFIFLPSPYTIYFSLWLVWYFYLQSELWDRHGGPVCCHRRQRKQ